MFECKGVNAPNPNAEDGGTGPWWAEIDRAQLNRYVALSYPVLYLFVGRPTDMDAPFKRPCNLWPCTGSNCRCCPRDTRSWGAMNDSIRAASKKLKFQPWFAHWSWVVEAKTVAIWIKPQTGNKLQIADDAMQTWSTQTRGVTRLCHLLTALSPTSPQPSIDLTAADYWIPAGGLSLDLAGLGPIGDELELSDSDNTLPIVYSASSNAGQG